MQHYDYICNMEEKVKQERAIVHLQLGENHYYYGNIKAMCASWEKDTLGVSYNYLRNYGLEINKPYVGKKCVVRKGVIVTSQKSSSTINS